MYTSWVGSSIYRSRFASPEASLRCLKRKWDLFTESRVAKKHKSEFFDTSWRSSQVAATCQNSCGSFFLLSLERILFTSFSVPRVLQCRAGLNFGYQVIQALAATLDRLTLRWLTLRLTGFDLILLSIRCQTKWIKVTSSWFTVIFNSTRPCHVCSRRSAKKNANTSLYKAKHFERFFLISDNY